ncbi:hypothetical protein NE553_15605, partial [Eggerthella lenta]|nr:hypothetical protein [Eggerthella lenta]
MTDSFNETKRELYELMQRSRRERFTPPTPEGVTPSEARTMMTVSALQHTCEEATPYRSSTIPTSRKYARRWKRAPWSGRPSPTEPTS